MIEFDEIKSIDTLVVLGGEDEERTRSKHAKLLYEAMKITRKEEIYITLCGYCNGILKFNPSKSEAIQMKEYLVNQGIFEKNIFTESRSLDTLGNFVFGEYYIKQALAGYTNKRVGVVTDLYHMSRALWTGKRVLGNKYELIGLPTEKDSGITNKLIQFFIINALKFDLAIEGIKPGDEKAFDNYLFEKHPFNGNNPKLGFYKLGIELTRLFS